MIIIRLWHEQLISKLPRQQLLGQHREVAALRGKGWNKPHSTVNYVFKHDPIKLVSYHYKIMEEMLNRGYNIAEEWLDVNYRGKIEAPYNTYNTLDIIATNIYQEHDNNYLIECLENLKNKGIHIKI